MTGASSVDQGVRVENTVIVEMWLAAAEQDLATRIPGLLESATQAKVEPLFVWSGLAMDEVERIDRFLGTLLAHHLVGGTAADIEAAKSVVDNHPLVTLASLVGRAARVASASEMWLEWAMLVCLTTSTAARPTRIRCSGQRRCFFCTRVCSYQ